MDDPFISCPYNKMHRVPQSRIQRHIIKCPDQNPAWETCPFKATHRVPKHELVKHMAECDARFTVYPDEVPPNITASLTTPKPQNNQDYFPESDPNHEIWDD